MDKRLLYIVVGVLVIGYLVSRKANPDLLEDARAKAVAIWTGKSASAAAADPVATRWEAHRREVFASRVADSKRRAMAKYPTLAVANSEMNIRFVYRYQWMVKDGNPRLQSPNWPELLADDCAASMHPETRALASKPDAAAHSRAQMTTSVATR